MTHIIAIINNKGGVGKTTSTLNIGAGLCQLGHKVLLVDLDSQANLSTCFGCDEKTEHHIGKYLLSEMELKEIIQKKGDLHLLPASNMLLTYEEKLSLRPMREGILAKKLQAVERNYDFILIDCPPSLGLMTNNALFASKHFIVPIHAEYFAYKGIANLLNHIITLNEYSGTSIDLLGIILVKYNEQVRENLLQGIAKKIKEGSQGERVFQTSIRQDKNLKESPLAKKDIFEYAPESRGAEDYTKLCHEIIARL